MLKNFLILRVSWLFGIHGNNFIKKIADQLLDNNVKSLTIVDDQIGRPTSVNLIAKVIKNYLEGNIESNIYNLQNSGEYVSKYDLAKFIKKQLKIHKPIYACKSKLFSGAKRQNNSYLDCSKLCLQVQFDRTTWNTDIINLLMQLYPEKFILKNKKCGIFKKLWLMIKNLF